MSRKNKRHNNNAPTKTETTSSAEVTENTEEKESSEPGIWLEGEPKMSNETIREDEDYVFGLDIGTRNVVGTVGYQTDKGFKVIAQYTTEHDTRAMLDGQIHDINRVAQKISEVKNNLEDQIASPLKEVCIAAAGRVLRTVTTKVEYDYSEETVVTGEDLNTLDLLGVDQAQKELQSQDDRYKFYCVGYTVMKYYLNGELFQSLEGHKANKIEEIIIVTFLPEDVVDGLYTAVERAGLQVANMTLEPIAAINVAIPENFRMLNISLVDVGAGTSDICVTKEGSIIAYGMIPYAGDELTEVLVQAFLVDFATAEQIKKDSVAMDEVVYKDIMGIEHKIKASEVWELTDPVMEKITTAVADKIKELNGGTTVAATFVVGGGGKVHGFCESLAEKLEIPKERVALRGEEVMGNIEFVQPEIEKDPLLVTPIGICLNYYEQKNNFIMIHFNGEMMKLYDNGHLKIVDAALQAGMTTDELFPQRGKEIHFTVNGKPHMARGNAGESAHVIMDGVEVGLNTRLIQNAEITIESSTKGGEAEYRIENLDEYSNSYVTFIVNGQRIRCPKFVEVNGSLEPGSYVVQDGDVIETRAFYTVGQLAAFMDVEVDPNHDVVVNNRSSDMDTLIYENFSIEWTVTGYGMNDGEYQPEQIRELEEEYDSTQTRSEDTVEDVAESADEVSDEGSDEADTNSDDTDEKLPDTDEVSEGISPDEDDKADENDDDNTSEDASGDNDSSEDAVLSDARERAGEQESKYEKNEYNSPSRPNTAFTGNPTEGLKTHIHVTVNGTPIEMSDRADYIFVDIFNYYEFNVNEKGHKGVGTTINGRPCAYVDPIREGDAIEIFWKD